ncbi:MAG TPA: hypothetical protein VMR50_13615 [Myxococcota bacterium]|nr:hypothetical protein [Myxococcota bacterium]
MSDQRYAPPTAILAEPPARRQAGQIDLGEAFREAWAALWPNFGLVFGTMLLLGLASAGAVVTIVGIFALLPVLLWGGPKFFLGVIRGEGRSSDAFAGFSCYGEALGSMVATMSLVFLIAMLGNSIAILGMAARLPLLAVIGQLANMAWSLLVMPRLGLVWYFVTDQGLGGMDAVRACWDATSEQKLPCLLLAMLSGIIPLVGFLFLIVGVIPAVMLVSLMHAAAYRQLVGR